MATYAAASGYNAVVLLCPASAKMRNPVGLAGPAGDLSKAIAVAVLAQIPVASSNLQNAISIGAVALVPAAIGIAVLRYRLYDIDRHLPDAGLRDRHRPAGRDLRGRPG